jgi:hypothetical protein
VSSRQSPQTDPSSGYDPTKLFQRKVNKRAVPDYYDIIKEPMALSTIKSRVAAKDYKSFSEYVRDLALIPHNAQVYNRQDSQAYVDALDVKKVIELELKKLVDDKTITETVAALPYLGEIPEQDALVAEEEEEEDDEDDDEELEIDDEDEEDEDGEGKRKRRRGGRSTATTTKREGGGRAKDEAKAEDPESRKKRGRPPRVDTPMEARIKAIMKGIRKPRNQVNKLMVSAFERVPDKAVMPEYHSAIRTPMAMDILKRKLKRKKYNSVDHFMQDVELMFENAKQYNEEDSQIYKDAVHLQKEARKIAKAEQEKPDTEYVMEEGRIPMPNGILHNGELWKVGDWVHIQNTNDLTKPIVAQIYRTWQDAEGGKWVNACWYYRPEQTVHRFDRHFLENEVVKTGQYRDHRIDEVIDRCFVMFVTRYNKGRPRDFPPDKEIYVCEARYNEENHKLNKIKTWASCLPDEVRDKDYVMDLFDAQRKLKKVPSPIAYMLKDDQKETDDLPKPEWGADNAPPKIGAVHCRPRDPKVWFVFATVRMIAYKIRIHLRLSLHLHRRRHHRHPRQWRLPACPPLRQTGMSLRETIPSHKHRHQRPCLLPHHSSIGCRRRTHPRTPHTTRNRLPLTSIPKLAQATASNPSPRMCPSLHSPQPQCSSIRRLVRRPDISNRTCSNPTTKRRSRSRHIFSTMPPTPASPKTSARNSSGTKKAASSSSPRHPSTCPSPSAKTAARSATQPATSPPVPNAPQQNQQNAPQTRRTGPRPPNAPTSAATPLQTPPSPPCAPKPCQLSKHSSRRPPKQSLLRSTATTGCAAALLTSR